jgi:hypothetical protein
MTLLDCYVTYMSKTVSKFVYFHATTKVFQLPAIQKVYVIRMQQIHNTWYNKILIYLW